MFTLKQQSEQLRSGVRQACAACFFSVVVDSASRRTLPLKADAGRFSSPFDDDSSCSKVSALLPVDVVEEPWLF